MTRFKLQYFRHIRSQTQLSWIVYIMFRHVKGKKKGWPAAKRMDSITGATGALLRCLKDWIILEKLYLMLVNINLMAHKQANKTKQETALKMKNAGFSAFPFLSFPSITTKIWRVHNIFFNQSQALFRLLWHCSVKYFSPCSVIEALSIVICHCPLSSLEKARLTDSRSSNWFLSRKEGLELWSPWFLFRPLTVWSNWLITIFNQKN